MNGKAKNRIVILGGGYAGILAALRLAGRDRQRRAQITLINGSDQFVERIRNHQTAANQPIRHYTIPKLLGKRPVKFVQGWVTALDLDAQTVQVDTHDGTQEIGYDSLVYTLGSVAAKPNIPGLADHAYAIANVREAAALRERLGQIEPGSRVTVVGGGLTGIESSSEIAERYPQMRVSLVTAGDLGAGLSAKGRAYLSKTLAQLGVEVHEQTRIQAAHAGWLDTGGDTRILSDVTVWAGSFEAATLARQSGLAVNARGQVLVDPYLRSISHPAVFVAGDAAAPVEDPGAPIRMGCVTAMPMAAQVADNVLAMLNGEKQQPFNFSYAIQCISLGRHHGLVQFVNHDDSATERILTGRQAAFVKEMICQFTMRSMQVERMRPGVYTWPGKGQAPAPFAGHIRQHI